MIIVYIFNNETGDDIHDYESESDSAPLVGDTVIFHDEGRVYHCLVKSRSWNQIVAHGSWHDSVGLHCDITEEKFV